MALSMDEQRILVEIESRLRADDPGLAQRLSGHGQTRHSRRMRLIAAFLLVVLGISTVLGSAIAYAFS